MASLSLTFLGAFQVTLGGKPLTSFRSTRVQALLIYLALTTPRAHSRGFLASLLWPDEPDTVAKKNLRQSLYQLRQVLEDTESQEASYLLVTRSTVQFNPASDYSLDVKAFFADLENTQLERAAALYQGDLLPGFSCDSLPFQTWLREQQERLHRQALDALFELADRNLTRGDYRTAQDLAQRQLALEPWREEAHQQLIQALALLGERSAALAQFEACKVILEEELGAEPSTETKSLAARIRNTQSQRDDRHTSAQPFERQQLTAPFVGREAEFELLARTYQQACQDGIQVIALLGETGIGKTRLAEHFLTWADTQGADILRAQAFETSGGLSYQSLTQVLRQRLERENAPEDLLSDLWLTQLTRIMPELRDRYPDLPSPTQDESTGRQHLFEAITRLIQALAERTPLIIFVDDWHWADSASMDVLHYAALRWAEERVPVLVLLTLRQEALTEMPDVQTWWDRLKHDISCVQLDLAMLSELDIARLVYLLYEPELNKSGMQDTNEVPARLSTFSRWLFKETDGQPIFLVETLKAMIEEGLVQPDTNSQAWRVNWVKFDAQAAESRSYLSTGVREIIRNWLGRITEPAADLLLAAAILGQHASFDHLCHVAGLEEMQAVTALDELLVKQLLLEVNETTSIPGHDPVYRFSHQMLGEAVYTEARAARQRIFHRRAFDVLQTTSAPSAELAHHALRAGLLAEAIRYSIAAGSEAMRLFAVRVAIVHYETAWQMMEQAGWPETVSGADKQDLYTGLGRAYELTELWSQAQDIYQAMIADARALGAPTMECLGLDRLAMVYINGFRDPQQATALLGEARKLAEETGNRRGLAETEWGLSTAARLKQDIYQARHHGEQALAIARALGHPQLLARCLNSLAYVQVYLRQWERAEAYALEARDLYAATGNQILAADSQRIAGWSQMYLGRPRESLVTIQETFAFSQEIENAWGEAECAWRLAMTLLELGQYGEAIKLARQAVRQARIIGQPTMIMLATTAWGTAQRTVMALEAARETLLEVVAESAKMSLIGYGDWALAELCTLSALAGDWDQAYTFAKRVVHFRDDASLLPVALIGWYETEALLRGGDEDLARARMERLKEIGGDIPRYQLLVLRSQAVLAQWDGDIDQAIQHLQAAYKLAQKMGLPGEEWSILAALGALYTDQGDQAQVRQALKTAAAIILQLAETIDEEEIRTEFLSAKFVRPILAYAV